jgi:hypothetical protein
MTNEVSSRSLLQEAFFRFNKENYKETVAKIVALNVFSFVVFFLLETIPFGYFFGMTVIESLEIRAVATVFNTLTCIYWECIENYFKSKMSNLTQIKNAWLRKKIEQLWEEVSLVTVKLLVNGKTYVVVGLMHGHLGSPIKLIIKVGVIVIISYFGANPLKNRITPFFRRLIFKEAKPVNPIFTVHPIKKKVKETEEVYEEV